MNPNGHLSRAERELAHLRHLVTGYEQQREEYFTFLSVMVDRAGGRLEIFLAEVKGKPRRTIVMEREVDLLHGPKVVITFVEPDEQPKIIT